MTERVLPENLSGEEIRVAILDKIARKLQKDCFLSPNASYEKFHCRVKIELRATDVGRVAEVKVEETLTNVTNPEDACLESSDVEFEILEAAPNEVRVDCGLPVPVLAKDKNGKPEIKGIKYSRPKLDKS